MRATTVTVVLAILSLACKSDGSGDSDQDVSAKAERAEEGPPGTCSAFVAAEQALLPHVAAHWTETWSWLDDEVRHTCEWAWPSGTATQAELDARIKRLAKHGLTVLLEEQPIRAQDIDTGVEVSAYVSDLGPSTPSLTWEQRMYGELERARVKAFVNGFPSPIAGELLAAELVDYEQVKAIAEATAQASAYHLRVTPKQAKDIEVVVKWLEAAGVTRFDLDSREPWPLEQAFALDDGRIVVGLRIPQPGKPRIGVP
jgi:hypothetical protein